MFDPLVGELGNLFVSTEKLVGGSIVVPSSCWQPNIELSRLKVDFFLLDKSILSYMLSFETDNWFR